VAAKAMTHADARVIKKCGTVFIVHPPASVYNKRTEIWVSFPVSQ
jgi:hypothetical protein